jgi:hypothetical protein
VSKDFIPTEAPGLNHCERGEMAALFNGLIVNHPTIQQFNNQTIINLP